MAMMVVMVMVVMSVVSAMTTTTPAIGEDFLFFQNDPLFFRRGHRIFWLRRVAAC